MGSKAWTTHRTAQLTGQGEKVHINTKNSLLEEVDYIRVILIVLLVLYHSFAPFCGCWQPIYFSAKFSPYWWIGWFSYSFFLEAFVFISGYILGYQVVLKGSEYLSFDNLVCKKFRRLIIPSILLMR